MGIFWFLKGSFKPRDCFEANRSSCWMGKFLFSRVFMSSFPTAPVAPTMATFFNFEG